MNATAPASALSLLTRSTVGKKVVMATTGLVLIGWLFLHMAGNLLVFMGQEQFNHYAAFIQSGFGVEPALLWVMRLLLLGCLVAHVASGVALRRRNAAARPVAYQGGRKDRATNGAAKSMILGGLVILLFLAFHLAHLTVGAFSEDMVQHAAFSHGDAYKNLVVGVGNPIVGAIYVLAQLALFGHLSHGVQSAFQTLGVNDPRWDFLKHGLGRYVPALVLIGNLSVALVCMFGVGTVIAAPDASWQPAGH